MSETNGHAKPAKRVTPLYQVEVFRVQLGETHDVRTLSPMYGGLNTHWYKGQSRYCHPKLCNPIMHREDQVWKGYFAAQVWVIAQPTIPAHWKSCVFEVTEALELDLRGEYRRGQIWQISRIPTDKKDNPPTSGILVEEHDPNTFAADFEIRNVLMNLYHTKDIDLSVKNAMPPRLYAAVEHAPPPAHVQAKIDQALAHAKGVEEQRQATLERIAKQQEAKSASRR